MPDIQRAPETEQELRRQTEDLAAALVLGDAGRAPRDLGVELAGALKRICGQAREGGWTQVAETAGRLAASFGDESASENLFREGVARLQRVLDEEAAAALPEREAAAAAASLSEDRELLGDFVMESREHIATVEGQLLTLEQDAANHDAIHAVFRGFHTIKGLAGFLELHAIRDVAHEVESLLDLARNSQLAVTPAVIDIVLAGVDYLKEGIERVEIKLNGGTLPPEPASHALLERIRRATAGDDSPAKAEAAPEERREPAEPAEANAAAPEAGKTAAKTRRNVEAAAVKVDTSKLDFLVDMVGELVIAQSLVRHDPDLNASRNPRLSRNLSQMARITSEVQKTAMAMRMIPVGQLFRREARLVRDLSRKAGKRAELQTAGDDVELDRTIVEELADPLMHMIRNSIDHGLETPEARIAAGKNPTGSVFLRAQHQAGHILIEVADDGRGLDRARILAKAHQRGLALDRDDLPDAEVYNLIFEPGFSTAEQVTDVSGRGVGMDVVRKHVQKLRGRVDVQSTPGQGTTFLIKLPLTLAIIEGLVVGVGNERYIVPIHNVREIFRPGEDQVSTVQKRAEMAEVRDRLLPVVRLYERFGVEPRSREACESLLIVAETDGRDFCLMVDELIGKQEVVIKSLGETLKNIPGVAGGAILGDGRVGLILDMDGVFT